MWKMATKTEVIIPKPVTIDFLRRQYELPVAYKPTQKTNAKKLIPFEELDMSLYNKQANCTVFLTNVKRMHFWLFALAKRLYESKGQSDDYVVQWFDFLDNGMPQHTELHVSVASSEDSDPDSFEYKVIAFLTTGKIMVQGAKYTNWCSEEFHETLKIVDELSQTMSNPIMSPVHDTGSSKSNLDDSVTFKKQVYSQQDESQPDENFDSTVIEHSEPTMTITDSPRKEPTVSEPLNSVAESMHSHKKTELVDEVEITELSSAIETLNSRFSIFETSLTHISADVLSINSVVSGLQQSIKNEITKAVKTIITESSPKVTLNDDDDNQEVTRLKKSIGDKEQIIKSKQETISSLNEKIKDNLALHESKISDVERKYQQQLTSLNLRIDNLNKENVKLDDQLAVKSTENEKLRKEIDILKFKLENKEQQISGLNDRLETIRLDYEGGEWMTSTPVTCRIRNSPVKDTQKTPEKEQLTSDPSMIIMEEQINTQDQAKRDNNTEGHDIIFIHDSIHKHLDYELLAKNTNKCIKNEFAATLEQFESKMSKVKLNRNGLLITHIGTNDIRRGENVNEAAKRYVNTIQSITQKGHKVIVSLLTSVKHRDLDKAITIFNQTITELLGSNNKVTFCDNKNIRGVNFLEKDGIHINKYDGTKKLAGNLKYTLCTVLDIKKRTEKKQRFYNHRGYNDYNNYNYDYDIDQMTNIVTAAIRAASKGRGQRFPPKRHDYWY